MPNVSICILSVGPSSPHTNAVLARLLQRGFGFHSVDTSEEAASVLQTFHFDVVLAPEHLPDGSGYDLAARVAAQSGSLVVSVQLSETCLWLPVVLAGSKVLGQRALNVTTLEWDLEEILKLRDVNHERAATKCADAESAAVRRHTRLMRTALGGMEHRTSVPLPK